MVFPVNLQLPSMTGSCIIGILRFYEVSIFFSAFNTLSYADVSVLASFLWCVNSNNFSNLFPPHNFSLIRDYVHMYLVFWFLHKDLILLYTWHPIFFVCITEHLQVFCWVSNFQFSHLTSLVMMTLLVSVFYNLYVYLVWLTVHPAIIALYVFSVIWFLDLSCLFM